MDSFKEIVHTAVERDASDLHMTVGLPPIYRIDGDLVDAADTPLTEEDVVSVVRLLANDKQIEELKRSGEVDFAVTFDGEIRMRCNAFYQQGRTALALRMLPLKIPTLQSLDMSDIFIEMAEKPRGLVLLTGPTGSGKSSTLAAMLDHIKHTRRRHIITLENPIEFIYKPDKCIINQREVGDDTDSFAAGLRAALRQDPDVILVGEMRDLETIRTAMTAAETGHLLMATLHTRGAVNTIDRVIDAFPADQQGQIRIQLSCVLRTVVSQQMLPDVNGGLVPAFEIMHMTGAVRSMIRDSKTHQIPGVIAAGGDEGMVSMDQSIFDLYRTGRITAQTALEYADNPEQMQRRMN